MVPNRPSNSASGSVARTAFGLDASPPNWRTTDAVDASLASNGINTKGLDALHVAGSGMYDKHQFETLRQLARTLHKPLVVLALPRTDWIRR